MANIIDRLASADLLLAIGLLLYVAGQAKFIENTSIGQQLSALAPIGALLIVAAAILAIYNAFIGKGRN